MPELLFPNHLFEAYLRATFPGKYVVCVSDSEDETKQTYTLTVLTRLFPDRVPNDWRFCLFNTGYALLVCETEAEAFTLYESFEDERIAPYTTVFGPTVADPQGTVLTENT